MILVGRHYERVTDPPILFGLFIVLSLSQTGSKVLCAFLQGTTRSISSRPKRPDHTSPAPGPSLTRFPLPSSRPAVGQVFVGLDDILFHSFALSLHLHHPPDPALVGFVSLVAFFPSRADGRPFFLFDLTITYMRRPSFFQSILSLLSPVAKTSDERCAVAVPLRLRPSSSVTGT